MTAIRPPEYFPRLEYCALMLAAERFVVADTFPFSRQSWHNRTKIRTPDRQGWQWLTVPRRHGVSNKTLNALDLDGASGWARIHCRALEVNYSMAPFYGRFKEEIDSLLTHDFPSLGTLTVATVRWMHQKLGAQSEIILASELAGAPSTLEDVWHVLDKGDTLITLPESAERERRSLPGATVEVFEFDDRRYPQNFPGYVPGLSALDRLFNCGP